MIELLAAPAAACLILVGIHCYLGMHVVSRGVIFVDLALAQIAVLGGLVALALGIEANSWIEVVVSIVFALGGAALFSVAHARQRDIPQEAIIGIAYGVASAAAILLLSKHPHGQELLNQMLSGSILYIDWPDVGLMALVYAVIGGFHFVYRAKFLALSNAAPGESADQHGPLWEFWFYTSLAIVVVLSTRKAGVLPVFGFLVAPAVAAMFIASGVRVRLMLGWLFGALGSAIGIGSAVVWDLPVGPAIVVALGAIVLVSAISGRLVQRVR